MTAWIKALTHPLGLVGFVLFLVFGLFAKTRQRDERRWLFLSAMLLALIALVGGLGLSYVKVKAESGTTVKQSATAAKQPNQEHKVKVVQISTGQGSPNVQDVQGPVTITVDQSSGKTEKTAAETDLKNRANQDKKK